MISGLTDNAERFLVFVLTSTVFSITVAQLFRVIASICPTADIAQPISGICTVIMCLFSGYIQPKDDIHDGWIRYVES